VCVRPEEAGCHSFSPLFFFQDFLYNRTLYASSNGSKFGPASTDWFQSFLSFMHCFFSFFPPLPPSVFHVVASTFAQVNLPSRGTAPHAPWAPGGGFTFLLFFLPHTRYLTEVFPARFLVGAFPFLNPAPMVSLCLSLAPPDLVTPNWPTWPAPGSSIFRVLYQPCLVTASSPFPSSSFFFFFFLERCFPVFRS